MSFKDNLTIVKVGGKIVEDEDTLNQLLSDFLTIEGKKILVHGGGRSATKVAERLNVKTQMVNGRRITSKDMLEVVTMVYGGLVNKNIVAKLQAQDVNALGLTGADLNAILSVKRPVEEIDYGYVGDIVKVNAYVFKLLLDNNIVPILAPLTHDGKGLMLNTNADTIASKVAQELSNNFDVKLVYCFEKKGVLSDESDDHSVIPLLDTSLFDKYVKSGVITSGMLPKLENAFESVKKGVTSVLITKASEITKASGTKIIL